MLVFDVSENDVSIAPGNENEEKGESKHMLFDSLEFAY